MLATSAPPVAVESIAGSIWAARMACIAIVAEPAWRSPGVTGVVVDNHWFRRRTGWCPRCRNDCGDDAGLSHDCPPPHSDREPGRQSDSGRMTFRRVQEPRRMIG